MAAQCSAPVEGHESAETREKCPACGSASAARAPVTSRRPASIAELEEGDRVILSIQVRGTYEHIYASVTRRTKTLVEVKGPRRNIAFNANTGYEAGVDRPGRSHISIPDEAGDSRVNYGRRTRAAKRAAERVTAALREESNAKAWGPDTIAELSQSRSRLGDALTIEAMTRPETLTPRTASGKPHPYTDEDVQALTAPLTRIGVDLVEAMESDSETRPFAEGVKAMLPVHTIAGLSSLYAYVGALANDSEAAGGAYDALFEQMERLQGYRQA